MTDETNLRVLLVSNYLADAQPSMQRFSTLLLDQLTAQGIDATIVRPPAVVGGAGKWLGYVDKFVLFPPRLGRTLTGGVPTVVHICDHSNAMYVPRIRHLPHVVTCHDLIAVRRALGEFPSKRTRWTGRRLQRMILSGLRQSDCIASDSEATRADVRRLVGDAHREALIRPAISPVFRRRAGAAPVERPYLLHVGGDQWYKNRSGLIDIYAALVARMPDAPRLVLVGKRLSADVEARLDAHGVRARVTALSNVGDEDLAALYSSAELLLFPSLVEGFGWPVAEAMACGCRVVASGRGPIPEIGGDAVTYFDPESLAAAATAVERVLRESGAERHARIAAGLSRAAAFTGTAMANAYIDVYRDALVRHRRAA